MRASGAKGLPLLMPMLEARPAQLRVDEIDRFLGYHMGASSS